MAVVPGPLAGEWRHRSVGPPEDKKPCGRPRVWEGLGLGLVEEGMIWGAAVVVGD